MVLATHIHVKMLLITLQFFNRFESLILIEIAKIKYDLYNINPFILYKTFRYFTAMNIRKK